MALTADFKKLWLGQAMSQLGDRIHQIATAWWVLEATDSAAMMGALWVATSLPAVVLAPLAGALADRHDRRRLMLWCDGLRAVLTALMAALAWQHALSVPGMFLLAVLLAALGAVFTPASLAVVPELVEEPELLRANALQELTTQGAAVLGPAVGGLIVATLGATAGFAGNALTFVISGLALMAMQARPAAPAAQAGSFWASVQEGLAMLRSRPAIASLLCAFAVANVFLAPIPVLLPLFARDVFHAGAGGLGLLEGALGGGMLLAALVLTRMREVQHKVALISGSFALQGLCMLGMGLSPALAGFAIALAVLGAALSTLNVVVLAAFQRAIPGEQLGRFMGLLMSIVLGIMPLSYGLAGLLATWIAPGHLMLASGAMLVLVAVGLPWLPGISRFQAETALAPEA